MTDAEKFEGFKQELLAENERKYGRRPGRDTARKL